MLPSVLPVLRGVSPGDLLGLLLALLGVLPVLLGVLPDVAPVLLGKFRCVQVQ